jgi:hypothetical protein
VFVGEGLEVGAAAGFVEASCAAADELLALAEALDGDGAERLGVEGGVEADDEFDVAGDGGGHCKAFAS